MSQADPVVFRVPLAIIVRPATLHSITNCAQLTALDVLGRVVIGVDCRYATDKLISVDGVDSKL